MFLFFKHSSHLDGLGHLVVFTSNPNQRYAICWSNHTIYINLLSSVMGWSAP